MLNFEIAGGSISGRHHIGTHQILKAANNQDAYLFYQDDDIIIGCVSDGCGSAPFSEVGSLLITRMVISSIVNRYKDNNLSDNIETQLYLLDDNISKTIMNYTSNLQLCYNDDDIYKILNDYFLCTIMGFIITKEITHIFYCGDGIYCINGEYNKLGPWPENAPPYLSYGFFPQRLLTREYEEEDLGFKYISKPTAEINSLLIGTDGVDDLYLAADKDMPGLQQKVGNLEQFWTQDAYFSNPDLIRRKLSVINKEYIKYDNEQGKIITYPGLLPDDSTLIVVRREPQEVSDENICEQ